MGLPDTVGPALAICRRDRANAAGSHSFQSIP